MPKSICLSYTHFVMFLKMNILLKTFILLFSTRIVLTKKTFEECQNRDGLIVNMILCLESDYRPSKLPLLEKGQPIKVLVKMSINSLRQVSISQNLFRYHVTQTRYWTDERISVNWTEAISRYILSEKTIKEIWVPRNHVYDLLKYEARNDDGPTLTIERNDENQERFSLSSDYSVEIKCNMKIRDFPFDIQRCRSSWTNRNYYNSSVSKSILFDIYES